MCLRLLSETQIITFCSRVSEMLKPGGMFFGRTLGYANEPGSFVMFPQCYLHTPDSLTALLTQRFGFSRVDVQIDKRKVPKCNDQTISIFFFGVKPASKL